LETRNSSGHDFTVAEVIKHLKAASELSSCRSISLTSIRAEIMEKMVSARFNWSLKTQNLLSPAKAGFRRYCLTVMLSQEIKDSLDRK
jgi:hypothetical protein